MTQNVVTFVSKHSLYGAQLCLKYFSIIDALSCLMRSENLDYFASNWSADNVQKWQSLFLAKANIEEFWGS